MIGKRARSRTSDKLKSRMRRHFRIRKKLSGDAERPRFCVTRTNRGLFAQLIDDDKGVTLASARTPFKKTANVEIAKELGGEIAKKAQSAGIKSVVFDRGGFIYHGKIAAVAEGARTAGLEF
ncbi:50S ribosomal protein L18 [bacterium]|nr:50S ribosomal protein L18 [bacterium]